MKKRKKESKKSVVDEKGVIEQVLGGFTILIGIISILSSFLQPLAGITLGIIGICNGWNKNTTLQKRGKLLSAVGIIISVLFWVVFIAIDIYFNSGQTTSTVPGAV